MGRSPEKINKGWLLPAMQDLGQAVLGWLPIFSLIGFSFVEGSRLWNGAAKILLAMGKNGVGKTSPNVVMHCVSWGITTAWLLLGGISRYLRLII